MCSAKPARETSRETCLELGGPVTRHAPPRYVVQISLQENRAERLRKHLGRFDMTRRFASILLSDFIARVKVAVVDPVEQAITLRDSDEPEWSIENVVLAFHETDSSV